MPMGQTAFTVRMDADIKKRFDELCEDFGMSVNTALNVFARTVVKQECIPFEVLSEKKAIEERGWAAIEKIRANAVLNGTADMSLEEINEEIRLARLERREKMAKQQREAE